MTADRLRVRWLGRVPYREALAVQQAMFDHGQQQHLLLLEHDHVFTYGRTADLDTNLKCNPADVGAELVAVRRGGDITYHGPGQLTGYPILNRPGMGSLAYVRSVEDLLIDVLARLGLPNAGRLADYPGVWIGPDGDTPRKIAAIGVRLARGRTMHGFALNNTTDLTYMRDHIIACGISDYPVTSLEEEGVEIEMRDLVDLVSTVATERWGTGAGGELLVDRADVTWRRRPDDLSQFSRGAGPGERVGPRAHQRMASSGVTGGLEISTRKPEWLRPRVELDAGVLKTRRTIRELDLVTVCEDAGCPNLSECWSDGTATFMVLGERCTRACGFCLVDTSKPVAPDPDEPRRVAEAVARMGLDFAVLTMVARDDLADGGMAHIAECVEQVRAVNPGVRVETLISDAKGDAASLQLLFDVGPDVLNHNLETVARLQWAVRPSASYVRSLSVLARAKEAGLTTKSSLMVGIGERDDEVVGALADLASIGCDVVTIGQYLRPTSHHLPVDRWVEPHQFDDWKLIGEAMGIGHVESSPLTRSSYHAKQAADAAASPPVSVTLASGSRS